VVHLGQVPVRRFYLHRRSVLLDAQNFIEARRPPGIDRCRECPDRRDTGRRSDGGGGTGELREI